VNGTHVCSWHFGDIHAARSDVCFRAVFGSQSVGLFTSGHDPKQTLLLTRRALRVVGNHEPLRIVGSVSFGQYMRDIGIHPVHSIEHRHEAADQAASPRIELPPQCDVQLMTEKDVLGFKSTARLEQVGNEYSERMQDRKHR